jgi:DNA-binding SARP family transcriptional activator
MESLRRSVHLISHQVPGLLLIDGPVLALNSLRIDLHDFLERVKICVTSGSIEAGDDCIFCLKQADLLPGWYDDWVILEQQRLHSIRLRAYLLHAQSWLDMGDPEKAFEAAEGALELEPLHENAVRVLIRADLQMGNRARAVRSYETFRAKLSAELGLEPSDDLMKLAVLR